MKTVKKESFTPVLLQGTSSVSKNGLKENLSSPTAFERHDSQPVPQSMNELFRMQEEEEERGQIKNISNPYCKKVKKEGLEVSNSVDSFEGFCIQESGALPESFKQQLASKRPN